LVAYLIGSFIYQNCKQTKLNKTITKTLKQGNIYYYIIHRDNPLEKDKYCYIWIEGITDGWITYVYPDGSAETMMINPQIITKKFIVNYSFCDFFKEKNMELFGCAKSFHEFQNIVGG
jgi:hypothetical protein